LEKIIMVLTVSTIMIIQHLRVVNGNGEIPSAARQIIVPVFKWLNRFICLPMWLDARIAPRCLSTVVLIKAIKV
jgi:hypothetical protein